MGTLPPGIRERLSAAQAEPRQVLPADPVARRRALLVVVVAAVAVVALLAWLGGEIAAIETQSVTDPDGAARRATGLFIWVTRAGAIAALVAAAGVWRVSRAVLRTGQYPLPGSRVLRDTRIRHGPDAERIARVGLVGAVLVSIAAVAIVVLGQRLLSTLGMT